MKKLFSLLLVLLLAFSMTAIAEEAKIEMSPSKLVGTWYADTAAHGSTVYRPTGDVRLELNRDKTAQFIHNDVTHTFTWTLSNDKVTLFLTLDVPDAMTFNPQGKMNEAGALVVTSIEDGTQVSTLGYNSMTYTFTRENNTTILPAAVKVEEEDSLFGTYTALYQMNGNNGEVISDAGITLRVDFAEAELNFGSTNELYVTDFADGAVVVYVEPNKYITTNALRLDNSFCHLTLSATEDASMIVAVATNDAGEVGATYYLTKNGSTVETVEAVEAAE
ncbi:MAG: hypothetical protein IKU34_00940 [Clostridia bacterium]|nr:hypothetical protein [Clostridia bacterium]